MGIQRTDGDFQAQGGCFGQPAAAQGFVGPALRDLAPIHLGVGLHSRQSQGHETQHAGRQAVQRHRREGLERNNGTLHGGSPAVA